MRLLLDTNIAVWALTAPSRIARSGRDLIADSENIIFVSAVTVWEIAIKRALGRRSAPAISPEEAIESFGQAGFLMLNVTAAHAAATAKLPLLHQDPFDRLLVAQALIEPLRMLTRDAVLSAYSETIVQV